MKRNNVHTDGDKYIDWLHKVREKMRKERVKKGLTLKEYLEENKKSLLYKLSKRHKVASY